MEGSGASRGLKHLRLGNVLAAVLNVLAAVLSRYNAEFRTQVLDYRHAWHLAAQADIRCCSAWLQRVACAGAAKTVDLHNASFGLALQPQAAMELSHEGQCILQRVLAERFRAACAEVVVRRAQAHARTLRPTTRMGLKTCRGERRASLTHNARMASTPEPEMASTFLMAGLGAKMAVQKKLREADGARLRMVPPTSPNAWVSAAGTKARGEQGWQ